MKKKVYLSSGISDTPRKNYQAKVARKIRELGYEVYAASENNSINDKNNDPTPLDIYKGNIDRVRYSDIFVACISGGNEDGTISEIGMVAGWNEALIREARRTLKRPITIIAYTSNERMLQPQFWNVIASEGMLARMKELKGEIK